MNGLKKTLVIAAAASLVCLSSAGAMAATNKLIVKDSTGATDKFIVTDDGFIGVGTTPIYSIQVVGAGASNQTSLYMHNTGRATGYLSTDAPAMYFFRNNAASVNGGLPRNNDRLGYLAFGTRISGTNKLSAVITSSAEGTWSSTSTPGSISLQTTSSGDTTSTEKVRITAGGYVGIGTSNPIQKLDVNGAAIRIVGVSTVPLASECNANTRGTIRFVRGTTDQLRICGQSGGTPIWRTITAP